MLGEINIGLDMASFPPPNAVITKLEDESIQDLPRALAVVNQFPHRPEYGKEGRPITLWANHLHINYIRANKTLYRYSITIQEKVS